MPREDVNTVIPGLLYQRANFLTWPRARKWQLLNRYNIKVVVNLWHKIDPDLGSDESGITYVYWPIESSLPPNHQIYAMVNFLYERMFQGDAVLVHCEAGVNRSAWLCARLLMEHLEMSPRAALEEVRNRIPRANLRDSLATNIMMSKDGK